MLNLAHIKGNNTTGVHMLQRNRKSGGFCIRVSPDTLKAFTSVDIPPVYRPLFKGKNELYEAGPYESIEEGAKELCLFVTRVCGVPCIWDPLKK